MLRVTLVGLLAVLAATGCARSVNIAVDGDAGNVEIEITRFCCDSSEQTHVVGTIEIRDRTRAFINPQFSEFSLRSDNPEIFFKPKEGLIDTFIPQLGADPEGPLKLIQVESAECPPPGQIVRAEVELSVGNESTFDDTEAFDFAFGNCGEDLPPDAAPTTDPDQFDDDAPPADDTDSDADGFVDADDNCPEVANADQSDSDSDRVGDACDNCAETDNPRQDDFDGNGVGDACQDTDGDGVLDVDDNCVEDANPEQADSDMDTIGDACDEFDNAAQDCSGLDLDTLMFAFAEDMISIDAPPGTVAPGIILTFENVSTEIVVQFESFVDFTPGGFAAVIPGSPSDTIRISNQDEEISCRFLVGAIVKASVSGGSKSAR